MTDKNPPHGGHEVPPLGSPGDAEPTPQWWEAPSTSDSTGFASGADPTLVRGPGQFDAYTPPPQPYAPPQQPYAPPQQQYAPPQQPYAPPQQPYAQPAPPPPGPPSYPQQPPYGTPYPGTPRRRSNTGWIVGGIAALIVVIALIGGLIVAVKSIGGGDKSWAGDYAIDKVTDSCSLVTPSILARWAPTQKELTHTENQPDSSFGGGSLNCNAKYEGSGINDASMTMDADLESKYGSPYYTIWKDIDTGTSGTGRASGAVSGLGEEAYFASREDSSSSFNSLDYTIGVLDSNLSVQVEITIYSKTPIDKAAVAAACEAQARQVMAGLRK
ncbi:hypothetical protein ACFQZZ_11040 [Nocardia sp. GCM10030253]|uniref:hypothetical protein n=1 Tax=Nocardia sp. GCM10030253 TaxID=3273404 RepID=UPI00364174D4